MQPPQRERRVAHPAVAVVPVALAAGRLGQRGRQRRDHRARRRVGQALEHERGALQVPAPRVVREGPGGEPLAPEVAGRWMCGRPRSTCRGPRARGPRERAEAPLALAHRVARVRGAPRSPIRMSLKSRNAVVAVADVEHVARYRRHAALHRAGRGRSEARRADQLDRHLALDALDGAHEHCSASWSVGGRVWLTAAHRDASRRSSARRRRRASPWGSSRSSRARWCPGGSVGPPARRRRRARAGTRRRARSSSAPKTLAESKRGRHSHSTEPSGATQRPCVAVREERVVRDRREASSFAGACSAEPP